MKFYQDLIEVRQGELRHLFKHIPLRPLDIHLECLTVRVTELGQVIVECVELIVFVITNPSLTKVNLSFVSAGGINCVVKQDAITVEPFDKLTFK